MAEQTIETLQTRINELEAVNAAAAADLRFLDAMERLGSVLRRAPDLDAMLQSALDALLGIFDCDRAWLLYPCDPHAASWGVPMERTKPEWPGVFAFGVDVPMDDGAAAVFREALATDGPLPYDATTERSVPPEVGQAFGVRSQIAIALRPHNGQAWLLGLHHCADDHVYTAGEQRIFSGLADRLADALDVMLLFRDLREREHQIAGLQRAEAIGELAGGVAHDFNNKLLVILCYAELLRDQLGSHPFIDQVVSAADGAASLTKELLAFSRRAVLQPRPTDLRASAHTAASLLGKAVGSAITLEPPPAGVPIVGLVDPAQLEQVIVNLVMNARDAMPDGGTVTLRTERMDVQGDPALADGSYAVLTVADDGIGMDEATRQRVFEPFFTTKERGHGTGLGLSTAFGVARQSGGILSVESEPASGSSFQLFIPSSDQPAADRSGAYAAVGVKGGRERVLLLDSDQEVAEVTAQILQSNGYAVRTAGTAAAALELVRTQPFDLLIAEVALAGLDGVRLETEVKELDPTVTVTFTTGYTNAVVEQLRAAGAARRLLQKPYTPERLLRHVRMVLDG